MYSDIVQDISFGKQLELWAFDSISPKGDNKAQIRYFLQKVYIKLYKHLGRHSSDNHMMKYFSPGIDERKTYPLNKQERRAKYYHCSHPSLKMSLFVSTCLVRDQVVRSQCLMSKLQCLWQIAFCLQASWSTPVAQQQANI